MDIHSKALDSIFDDMDDMETKKMFPEEKQNANGGVDITISIAPKGGSEGSAPEEKMDEPDHEEAMCKGGCAYHKGGIVSGEAPEPDRGETDDLKLPPFLRKKKIPSNR